MNKNLANTIGDRINEFDNLEDWQKYPSKFNEIFPECPLKKSYIIDTSYGTVEFIVDDSLTVTIGEPDSNNCRIINLFEMADSEITIKHKMYSDILYTMDRQDFYLDEREVELTEINGVPV